MYVNTVAKIYRQHVEYMGIPLRSVSCYQKESVSCSEVSEVREIVMFGNSARIASPCVCFHLGTLHGYFFHQDFWANLNFPLEHQIKLVLISELVMKRTFRKYILLPSSLLSFFNCRLLRQNFSQTVKFLDVACTP